MEPIRPVNERLSPDVLEVFAGPMSIPGAIGSFQEIAEKNFPKGSIRTARQARYGPFRWDRFDRR